MGLLRSKNFFISTWTVTNGIPTPDFDQIEFDVQQGNKVGPAIILGILEHVVYLSPGHRIIRFCHCIYHEAQSQCSMMTTFPKAWCSYKHWNLFDKQKFHVIYLDKITFIVCGASGHFTPRLTFTIMSVCSKVIHFISFDKL